ncbi:glycosyltransferase family 2 protein [Hymenobacter weizhouensis]|uniref:glycosyltransferase family 2 protein n=1 Tax=Hymenobacter sp. YIM 151500-1 TaxID=2987689 RepID=UPI0022276118|nr:glycosyltransferase family 2 protein [Hymenobacter sp. YIM 151500-1]UYZ64545.1 glycosyltransferase [Hymenobacter sp. YIM 151500-1]
MPGLSVLIPVFNRDVRPLVHALRAQVAHWPGPVEICCLDDGSAPAVRVLNQELAALPGVQYQELACNVGRAAIRNQLAQQARHEWLLLLDNDSVLPDGHFLARYAVAQGRAAVLVGGTSYEPAPPPATDLRLRWLYGRRREARPAAVRQRAPYGQLTLNNLLVRADVFCRLGLDESLTRYGHEDTKFGWLLRRSRVPVLHLDNPVLHDGLEPAAVFLQKSHDAVRNLVQLYRAEGLGADTKLLKAGLQLQRWGLGEAVRTAFGLRHAQVQRNLLSERPSLRQLDALKLFWLLSELNHSLS